MKLHEYQAKRLFASLGIPVPRGAAVSVPSQAAAAYETLKRQCLPASQAAGGHPGEFVCSVKAQLHAGGRGKAGGVLAARSASEAVTRAEALIGRRLVTAQTGSEGLPVSCVLLEECLAVREELYLALTIDRFRARPVILASRSGGMDIEAVAAKDPNALVREPVEIGGAVPDSLLARLSEALGCVGDQAASCAQIIRALWTLFQSSDASLIEVNPLVFTSDGRLTALDAKVTLDDNALFRHTDLAELRDESQEHPLELKAGRIGISYVGLSGNIGCLVNGAGLAMATNDIIKLCGGEPANFLDVGGGANVEQVTNAFSIILADDRVRAILVNIFGGIMRCDWIAQGLLNATRQLKVKVPIVVRLQGTNVEEGRRLLAEAKQLNLISVDELADAARKVVELAR
jgi:succinyl-CoA synthetase beta subunit